MTPVILSFRSRRRCSIPLIFAGGGQVGALIRLHDWSASPLGPPEHWRFVQVLANLLHNATKFTGAGGSIVVSAHINGGDDNMPGELELSVVDSGIGIPAEFQPRVFELFTQGARGSSEPGLGIGLALARRLIDMHGGQIEVHSKGTGHGSGSSSGCRSPRRSRPIAHLRRLTGATSIAE